MPSSKSLEQFYSALPSSLREFCHLLFKRQWKAVFVGGVVRDFLRTGAVGRDFDLELHSWDRSIRSPQAAKLAWEQLQRELTDNAITFRCVFFGIIKVDLGDGIKIDLSPPRTESFFKDGRISHKNFFATLFPRLDYKRAWQRRDFTINSMGIEVSPEADGAVKRRFVDPFGGYQDLRNGVLRSHNPNFEKDPVRFLRAIDFGERLGLDYTRYVETVRDRQDLQTALRCLDWKRYAHTESYEAIQRLYRDVIAR